MINEDRDNYELKEALLNEENNIYYCPTCGEGINPPPCNPYDNPNKNDKNYNCFCCKIALYDALYTTICCILCRNWFFCCI